MQPESLQVKINTNWLLAVVVLFCILVAILYPNIQHTLGSASSPVTDIEYLVDVDNQLDLPAVMNVSSQQWQNHPAGQYSFGMLKSPHWFKFTLSHLDAKQAWLLEVDYPLLDKVSVWFAGNAGILTEYHTGDSLPFSLRPVANESFLFPVPKTEQLLTVYMRVETAGALRLSVNVWSESDYISVVGEYSIIMGLFLGLMLAMGISNFFYFITTRSRIFAVYSAYVMFLALSLASRHGQGYKFLWSESAWFQQHALPFFSIIAVAFFIIFCNLLLEVKQHNFKLSRTLTRLAAVYLVCGVVSLILPLSVINSGFLLMLLAGGLLIYGVTIWLWIKGVGFAGVYTLASSVLLFSGFMICLDYLNIAKLDVPADYLIILGAAIEVLILALVLAINNNQQRQALQVAQNQLLAKAMEERQNQESILAAQENAKEDLEYKVQERTLELEIALRELSETNRELQEKTTLDALTGVRNRSYFDKKYLAEIRRSRRERTQLSVVMIDIDHFKNINDKYGHLVGDECIKSVANTLKNALKRPSDDLCRYGGEEFVLILPSTELAGATSLVEQVRQTIEELVIKADGFSISLTISAGIATAVANPHEAEDVILAAADQQLYLAKDSGRNNVQGVFLSDDADTSQE